MALDHPSLSVSNEADFHTRAAIKNVEDELHGLVQDLNDQALFPADVGTTGTGSVVYASSPTLAAPTVSGTLSSTGAVSSTGVLRAHSGTAIPAGGTAGAGVLISSTTNFGMFFGSGAPTLSAAQGSIYLRSNGSGTGNRIYINTDGGTTWTAIVTVA